MYRKSEAIIIICIAFIISYGVEKKTIFYLVRS